MTIRRKHTKGFTLIEVLVCIAMVGILFAPLLTFFPGSLRSNNGAKNMQRANAVAQKIVEEVRAYDSIAAMCSDTINLTRTDEYGNVCTDDIYNRSPIYDGSDVSYNPFNNETYYFVRNMVESDGQRYVAKIKVDTSGYARKEVQDVPMLASLGSDSTIMAMEKDETKSVINKYQHKYMQATGTTISKKDIAKELKKTVKIGVTDSAPNNGVETIPDGMVRVQIYNAYSMKSSMPGCGEAIVSDMLYNEEVKYEDLKGIYLFYNYDVYYNQDILTNIEVDVKYPIHGSAWKIDYKLYAICQGICNYEDNNGDGELYTEQTSTTMMDYANAKGLYAHFSAKYNNSLIENMPIWSNFKAKILRSDGVATIETGWKAMDEIVSYIKEQRLADITVSLYKEDDLSKAVVEITSTRGE